MVKRMKLPKDQLVAPEERAGLIDSEDVEGHGLPTTAPPALSRQGPGHGGEVARKIDDDGDDIEGHRAG